VLDGEVLVGKKEVVGVDQEIGGGVIGEVVVDQDDEGLDQDLGVDAADLGEEARVNREIIEKVILGPGLETEVKKTDPVLIRPIQFSKKFQE